ncbi:SH3 domain-containing protein [Carnobacterium maltaromaticum]|uniref:SH3 domain-containing protein n=1 Tax=Carnobacterium maltaromaticum TaxID=2751 RepID=UPI0039BDBFA2
MKKLNKVLFSLTMILGLIFPTVAGAVNVEQRPMSFIPSTGLTTNEFVIAHESGNANNVGPDSLEREISFMSNNFNSAFVSHWVGGGGRAVQIAPTGFIQWGAGPRANGRAYAQVELARTNNAETFKKDYVTYVNLLRQLAKEAGVPVSLDAYGKGIKSHLWVTQNLGGTDHSDPYAYLAQWGISKTQFAADVANGIDSSNEVKPNPIQPPVNPSPPVTTPSTGKTLNLPATSTSWRIYGLNSSPVAGNEVGFLNPSLFGGLSYSILSDRGNGVYEISTRDFGRVQIYGAASTGATVKGGSNVVVPPSINTGGRISQTGIFFMDRTINVRHGSPSISAPIKAQYFASENLTYDSYIKSEGYIWLSYTVGSQRYYVAWKVINGEEWGIIK